MKKIKRLILLLAVVALISTSTGCTGLQKKAGVGAGIGAGLGAVAGGLIGGGKGAAIGAGIGALTGAVAAPIVTDKEPAQ